MIKVNLYNNVNGISIEGAFGGDDSADRPIDQKEALIKLLMVFGIPILMYIYESYNVGNKRSELARINRRLNEISSLTEQNGMAISEVEKYIQEKEKLKEKFVLIGKLAKPRLTFIKSLDALQGMIPVEIWIDQVSIQPEAANAMERNSEPQERIVIKGKSLSYDAIIKLTNSMQESIFFNRVTFRLDEQTSDRGNIKAFEITCLLKQEEDSK